MMTIKNLRVLLAFVVLGFAACRPTATPPASDPVGSAPTAAPSLAPTATVTEPAATPTIAISPTPVYDAFAANLPAGDASFAIPPAIQHVTETSAILYFAFDDPAPGAVFYRSAVSAVEAIAFGENAKSHLITLPDLRPGTTYDALVVAGKESDYSLPQFMDGVWGAQTVTTPPFASPLRFAAIGDSGFGDDATRALAAQILAQDPSFVIHVGDVVYFAGEQRNPGEAFRVKYFDPFAPLLHRVPVYPSIGNHDVEAATLVDDIPYYFTAFPPFGEPTFPAWNDTPLRKWYAFSFGGIQFLSLDTQALFGDPGKAEQEAWLEERLADTSYAYTIVFGHVPRYTSGRHRGDGQALKSWAADWEEAGVPLALAGHDHAYERLVHGPTTYIVSGGGSATLYKMADRRDESQFYASESQFTLVDVYPDRIEVKAIDVEGTVIDEAAVRISR